MDPFDIMMVALRFNEKINQRDLDGLVKFMTDDHTFIDNSGDVARAVEFKCFHELMQRSRCAKSNSNLTEMGVSGEDHSLSCQYGKFDIRACAILNLRYNLKRCVR